MSILKSIFDKIFHSAHADKVAPSPQAAPSQNSTQANPNPAPATPTVSNPAASTQSSQISEVDVEKILTELAVKSPQPLNWRTSIVDLLKLLNLDSSLQARKELAQELHYTGSTEDSASMNIWLHKQVMQKLAENGGKVPSDLKD